MPGRATAVPLPKESDFDRTTECEHPAGQVCRPRLERSLQVQLDQDVIQGFGCPLCKKPMFDRDAKCWAKPQVFQRYQRLRTRRALNEDPNFVWCSNPRCEEGQVHTSGPKSPMMTCKKCRTRTCFTHQRPWHEGMTCFEYDNPRVMIKQTQGDGTRRKRQRKNNTDDAVPRKLRKVSSNNPRRNKAVKRLEKLRTKRDEEEAAQQASRAREKRRTEQKKKR